MSTPDLPRPGDDDIDAEFARLTEGLDFDSFDPAADTDVPQEPTADERERREDQERRNSADGKDGVAHSRAAHPAGSGTLSSDEEQLTVEDILGEASSGEPTMAVIATAVATGKALAGAIRLGVEAVESDCTIPAATRTYDGEYGALASGQLTEAEAHELATIASTALQRNAIVLFWRRGDRMTATRYRNGQREDDMSPALVLGAVDPAVEQLVLGAEDLDRLGTGYDPSALSREDAMTWIQDGTKKRWWR